MAKTYRICCKANISSRAKRRHIDKIKIASVDTEAVLLKKKDEKLLKFLILFLSVGIFNFILLYRKRPVGRFFLACYTRDGAADTVPLLFSRFAPLFPLSLFPSLSPQRKNGKNRAPVFDS